MLPKSAEQRFRDSGVASLTETTLDVVLYALVSLEVAIDEIRSFLRSDAELLREAIRGLAVNDPEIDCFRAFPLLRCDGFDRKTKNFSRGSSMNVFSSGKCRRESFVPGKMRDDTQLNL